MPAILKRLEPAFPERRTKTRFDRQRWAGEVEIGADGKVLSVKVLRRVSISPPWPEWEAAIPVAVRNWRFAPTCLGGQSIPVFTTIEFDPISRQFHTDRRGGRL